MRGNVGPLKAGLLVDCELTDHRLGNDVMVAVMLL